MNKLSNEIITLIAENLRDDAQDDDWERSQQYNICVGSIMNFMRSSRRYHKIVEPVLYTEFIERTHSNWQRDRSDLVGFLCQLVARPDLRARVKKLHCRRKRFVYPKSPRLSSDEGSVELDVSMVTEQEWNGIDAIIKGLTDDKEKVTRSLWSVKKGCWEATLVLVLSLLPNLESIVLNHMNSAGCSLLDEYLQSAATSQHEGRGPLARSCSMPSLKRATLLHWDTRDGVGPEVLFPWMALPSMRSITSEKIIAQSATRDAEDGEEEEEEEEDLDFNSTLPDWAIPQEFPNVTCLSLGASSVHETIFSYILQCLPNLEDLKYEQGALSSQFTGLRPQRLLREICLVKNSLLRLSLRDVASFADGHMLAPIDGESLSDLTKLQVLETQVTAFLGELDNDDVPLINNLPPNLKVLRLDGPFREHVNVGSFFLYLLDHISLFPSLKQIDLGWRLLHFPDGRSPQLEEDVPGFERDEAIKLLEMCKDAGIEMVMKGHPPPSRVLHDWWDDNVWDSYSREPERFQSYLVKYPYDRWEELCLSFNCNPATGRRWDSVHPSLGITLVHPFAE